MPHEPYVSFTFYQDEYMGTLIPTEKDWLVSARMADAFIDGQTMHRLRLLAQDEDVPREAAFAICAVAEEAYRQALAVDTRPAARIVKSAATTDGYSETFLSPAEAQAGLRASMLAALDLYLPRTDPLRYRGV